MYYEYYDSEEQEFWEAPACEVCPGRCSYLGQLGKLHWWQCRQCGHKQHTGEISTTKGQDQ